MAKANWTRDEIILALELYLSRGTLDSSTTEVRALSTELKSLPLHPIADRASNFRNDASIAFKLLNLATLDPAYDRPGFQAVSRVDREVWDFFGRDLERTRVAAAAIRAASLLGLQPSSEEEENFADEGALLYRLHRARERNRSLVMKKKAQTVGRGVPLDCEVCGFNFERVYGKQAAEYIECHHRRPLSLSGPTTTRLEDLALLCANCHSAIRASRPWLSVEELSELVVEREGS